MKYIDKSKIEKLTNGDDWLVADLAVMFVKSLPELESSIRFGIDHGELHKVVEGAHQLKSRVSYFGASKLREQAGEMEMAAARGQRKNLPKLNNELFEGIYALIEELRSLTNLELEVEAD